MAHDVSETTLIPRAPKGREEAPVQISRLRHAHEIILKEARAMARRAAEARDDGTNDLIVSDVIRRNELQAWFIAEHVMHVTTRGDVKRAKVDTSMSTLDRIGIRHVDVERTTVISAQPFAVVVSKLAAAIGHPDMSSFAHAVAAARTSADLEGVVNAVIGSAGLTEMARFDIGEVLRKEVGDDAPKALRLVMGNPLIMKEMVKHVPDAASYAPVTVLIDERPDGVYLSYDLMASLLAPYGDAEASAVARQLDDKVMALLTAAAE
jgi:uncharacterized protein (DUF302 family)